MRKSPNLRDEYDVKDLLQLNAEKWQIDLLDKNPEYVWWGNYEDYMSGKENGNWGSPVELERFSEVWEPDELNEIVNFYFSVQRENHECPKCEGNNLNPETMSLSDDWYDFERTGRRWCDDIGEVEVEALVKGGRLSDLMDGRYRYDEKKDVWLSMDMSLPMRDRVFVECDKPKLPTPEEVNVWSRNGRMGGHDAINRWICVEARAKHLGVYGHCDECEGGYIYDEDKAKVSLQLWFIHPRKGSSRGVYIKEIKENEIPDVVEYLKVAAKRNQNRFEKL